MAKTFILHDESLNTFGFWIKSDGINLEQLRKNPVMLFQHIRPGDEGNQGKDMILPIGNWENIRLEQGKILAEAVFDTNDPFAKRIADKVESGFIKMASIAVSKPWELSIHKDMLKPGQARPTVVKCLAKEASIVDMGSNMNALRLYDEDGQMITLSDSAKCAIPLIKEPNQNQLQMKKVLGLLKLADDANEAEAYSAIVKLNEKVTGLEAEKLKLEADLLKLKNAGKADQEAKVKDLLDGAVKDRKILEINRATYLKLAEQDFDSTKAALDAMPVLEKLADGTKDKGSKSKFEGKSWDDLDKANLLGELKLADISRFKDLYKEKFNAEYKG